MDGGDGISGGGLGEQGGFVLLIRSTKSSNRLKGLILRGACRAFLHFCPMKLADFNGDGHSVTDLLNLLSDFGCAGDVAQTRTSRERGGIGFDECPLCVWCGSTPQLHLDLSTAFVESTDRLGPARHRIHPSMTLALIGCSSC